MPAYAQGNADSAGMTTGEVNLDFAQSLYYNTVSSDTIPGSIARNLPFVGGVVSILQDSFEAQYPNKENALNQNIEIDVAKQNLQHSKDNVKTMFFYIVAVLTILFDVILSIVYIVIISLFVWLIFVGYVRVLIMVIDFIKRGVVKWQGK